MRNRVGPGGLLTCCSVCWVRQDVIERHCIDTPIFTCRRSTNILPHRACFGMRASWKYYKSSGRTFGKNVARELDAGSQQSRCYRGPKEVPPSPILFLALAPKQGPHSSTRVEPRFVV